MTMVSDFRLFQWGKETTRGTSVPATSKIMAPIVDLEPIDMLYRPDLARGILSRSKGAETIVKRGTDFTVPDSTIVYEQLQHWLLMSVKGGVSPAAGVWTFTRDPVADPALDTFTIERRLNSGAAQIDNEWAYCMGRKIGFKGGDELPLMFNFDGFARRIQTSTLTPALTYPTSEVPPFSLSKAYMDSTWANLGTTVIAGVLLYWEINFTTGARPLFTADARADQDFTAHGYSSADVQIDATLRMMVKSAGQYDIEKTAAEAGTLRALRVQVDNAGATKQIQFDALLKHVAGSAFKIGEFEGQDIIEHKLQESYDGTNLFRVKLTNTISSLV